MPTATSRDVQRSARLWAELKNRWGVEGYWYPLDRAPDAEPPPDAQAFNADPFFDAHLQQQLREALAELGVARVWELRELETATNTEVALLEPVYTGAEGYFEQGKLSRGLLNVRKSGAYRDRTGDSGLQS